MIIMRPAEYAPFIQIGEPLYGPITLRKSEGDRLFLVTEDNGVSIVGGAEVFFSALITPDPDIGFTKLDRLAPGIIHTLPPSGEAPSGAPACYRSLIKIPADATPGTHFSVYVAAQSLGMTINSIGIGKHVGIGNMAAAPVPMLSQPLALAPNVGSWLGPVALGGVNPGDTLAFDIAIPASAPWALKLLAPPGFDTWYSATNSATTAAIQGTATLQPRRTHAIYAVKWWTP
jgi:hypothetical protein